MACRYSPGVALHPAAKLQLDPVDHLPERLSAKMRRLALFCPKFQQIVRIIHEWARIRCEKEVEVAVGSQKHILKHTSVQRVTFKSVFEERKFLDYLTADFPGKAVWGPIYTFSSLLQVL